MYASIERENSTDRNIRSKTSLKRLIKEIRKMIQEESKIKNKM